MMLEGKEEQEEGKGRRNRRRRRRREVKAKKLGVRDEVTELDSPEVTREGVTGGLRERERERERECE